MKKLITIPFLMIYLLSACANYAIQTDTTETPVPTTTQTPVPPTATATPLPVPINANNFSQIEQVSTSVLDQSKFVGFNLSKIGFLSVEANVPDGDFKEAYFLSYQRLDNGDIVGLLIQLPLNCGLKTFGQDKRNCSTDRYYYSMINLSQGSILWTQFIPINMAGKELNDLIAELGIENFKPGFGSSSVNGGFWVNKWSNDNLQIAIPVQIVNTTLVKDTLSGKNIVIHPWGGSPSWIGVVSPDKTKFAFISGGPQGKQDILRIMNIADQTIDIQFEVSNSATDMVWSGDNSKIAVGKFNGSVDVFYLDTKETKNLVRERYLPDRKHGQGITRLKFSEDGMKIALTENNYTITDEKISRLAIYDLETRKEVNSYSADFYQTGNLIWSHDGSFVVTVTDFTDGRIVLMNENTIIEYSLIFPDNIAEYYPREFTSLIYFNDDQTQLTLIRSLFNDAVVTEYKVKK